MAALVIQAYRQSHGGTSPSPALIKQILVSTADDLGHPADEQGSGLVDAYRAVLAAESSRPAAADRPMVGRFSSARPTPRHRRSRYGRILASHRHQPGSGSLHRAPEYPDPRPGARYPDQQRHLGRLGATLLQQLLRPTENYQTTTFTVAPGRDRLAVEIAYQGHHVNNFLGNVDVVLIDPDGNFAADAVPQGVGNTAAVEVRYPTAGTWTALIFSNISSEDGTVGPVLFQAQTFDFQTLGTVSPAQVTVPAGGTATVKVRMTTPSSPGDEARRSWLPVAPARRRRWP